MSDVVVALRAALAHALLYARDRVMLAVLGGFALVGACLVLAPAGAEARVRLYWAVQPLLDLLMVLLSRRAAVAAAEVPSTARFWRWLSRAACVFVVGDVVQVQETWRGLDPDPVAGGTAHVAIIGLGVLTMIVVTLTHPLGLTGSQRRRTLIDTATVVAAAATVVWYLDPLSSSSGPVLAGVLLVSVFGLVRLALSAKPPFTRAATLVGVVGVATTGLAQAVPHGSPGQASSGPALAAALMPSVLVALAPRVQELAMLSATDVDARRHRPYSVLPYLGLAASLSLLVVAATQQSWAQQIWGLLAGNVLVMILVVLRQLDAFRENAELLGRLDASLATLARAEERFRSLVQNSSDVTLILDGDGTIRYASPALHAVLGVAPDAVLGRQVHEVFEAGEQPAESPWPQLLGVGSSGPQPPRRIPVRHTDGSWRRLEVTLSDLRAEPSVAGIVCNARDTTEAHELQARLEHQATHDPLTQLANRAAFDEQTRRLVTETRPVSVLLIDLNGFKPINDTYGHHAGDELLVAVADRIAHAVRPGDVVARLGGDEFAVLLRDTTQEHAVAIAQRIRDVVAEPVQVGDDELLVGASIGVASGPSERVETLVRDADAAMYTAKRDRGGAGYACAASA